MKITMHENEPAAITFPVIMIAEDGCIKMFFNEREGVMLAGSWGPMVRLDAGSNATTCTPVISSYWKPYDGVISLSND